MTEAELFDGTVLEFPDGTSPEVIQRVVKEQTMQRRNAAPAADVAPAAPAAEPSMMDTIMGGASAVGGVLDQGARGFATGVTNILGLPQMLMQGKNDMTTRILSQAGVPEDWAQAIGNLDPSPRLLPSAADMQGAGDTFNEATAQAVGVEPPNPVPDNMPERFANRIGEELGATALPAAGILGKAEKLRQTYGATAPAVAREGGKLSRMFIEPATVNPGRFLQNEVTTAAAAGTGAAAATEKFPDSPFADVAGALGGVGLLAGGSSMLKGGTEMGRAIFGSKNYVDDVVRDAVTDRVAEAARVPRTADGVADTTSLVDDIMTGRRIGDDIPGVQESLADRTRNPGIASLEYSRQSGPSAGTFNARRQNNARAVDEAISGLEPQGSPAALRGELDLERTRQLTDAETLALNARDAAESAVAPVTPAGTPTARGNTVRSALEEARDAARARTEEAYGAANVGGTPIQTEELLDAIDGATSGMAQADQAYLPESLISRIQSLGDNPATMKEATALRSELREMGVAASKRPGGRNEARVLGAVEKAVDDFIFAKLPPDQQDALRAARATRTTEGQGFDRVGDPVQRALAENDAGYRMSDERVAGSFTNPQAMDRLFTQADTPQVRTAIRDEILSGADVTRADKIKSFIDANAEKLDRFPGLRDELTAAAKGRADETAALARKGDLERTLGTDERAGTGTVGKFLSFSDANSDKAIREVLSAKDPAKAADELLTFVGDAPDAVNGARKALWDNMSKAARRAGETTKDASGAQQWMPEALSRWLNDPRNAEVAKRFYKDNPEHVDNLRKISDALQGLDIRNTAKVPNTSGTAQSTLPSTETLGSMALAYKRGQIGPAFIATRLGAVFARRSVRNARSNAIERMMDDVLLNPDDAALLLRENNPANRAALGRKAKLWFGNEASTIMNALTADDEDEDDEIRRAATAETSARPFDAVTDSPVDNGDGTFSTERSRTVNIGGDWANVPSLWFGGENGPVDLSDLDDDALAERAAEYERQSGKLFPRFGSIPEAEAAAKKRSAAGGATKGSLVDDSEMMEAVNGQ